MGRFEREPWEKTVIKGNGEVKKVTRGKGILPENLAKGTTSLSRRDCPTPGGGTSV